MKKRTIIIIVATAVAAVVVWGVVKYNIINTYYVNALYSWTQVEDQYKARTELVPQLINLVEGYTELDSTLLESVVQAQTAATQLTPNPTTATHEELMAYFNAQDELDLALDRIVAMANNQPELKADEKFIALRAQLEDTENHITKACVAFNVASEAYNERIRRPSAKIIARLFFKFTV